MRLTLVALLATLPAVAAAQTASVVQSPPNAPWQTPAFEGQTRAPQPDVQATVETETIAQGLPQLWALEFLPDGRMLVTAKRGSLHIVTMDGDLGPAIEGVPSVDSEGQGGLLDVAIAPDFDETQEIWMTYAEPRGGPENATTAAKARLVLDEAGGGRLEDIEAMWRQTPIYNGDKHFGSRIAFAPDGTVFITTGERSDRPIRDQSQDLTSTLGKVIRINRDGTVPDDNPFVGNASIEPAIWSYGHRNLQSAVIGNDGALWTVEHGPRGGDELNKPEAGLNYGWPVITYGINYSGTKVGGGITAMDGMEQPIYYWDPVIAPSGMAQYSGDEFPAWEGAFLVGGLVSQGLVVLHMENDLVAAEERVPLAVRVRDVKLGPDGAVYVVGEAGDSSIIRLTSGG